MPKSKIMATFADKMKDFSLLMSVYQRERPEFLTACFDSIYNQTVRPSESVLVEDGPLTPALYEAISSEQKRFGTMKRVALEQNQGLGAALNAGMKACSYDIVARMDTDDICLPQRFEAQLTYLEAHPEIDVLGAWISEFDGVPTNVVGVRRLPENHEAIYKFGKKRNPTNHPTVMFRKQAVMDAGGYQPFPLFEDYYLWARMLNQGHLFHNLQQPLLLFRRSPQMISRRGGVDYAHHEVRLFHEMYQMGYISLYDMVRNILQRYIVRLLPNVMRSFIYRHLLRAIP